MSRRTKQPATSRRTRRAEQPQPPAAAFAFAETPRIVSNPIFYCESGPSQSKPPGDELRCVYGPGSVRALVQDPVTAAAGSGIGKPLPLPPCRAHRAVPASGSHKAAARVGPALVVNGPHGRVLRRAPQDPFLAAYMACSKSAGKNGAQVKRQQEKKARKRKEGAIVRGCGIWNGWAAGAKYAGAMSCRYGCAVAAQAGDAPAAMEKVEEKAPAVPTLDLSWAPAVLSARALERRREQR